MDNQEVSAYKAEREKIMARPCRCVSCPDCRGTGSAWYQTGGYPEEDLETCGNCNGLGITESCQRCDEIEELEQAHNP